MTYKSISRRREWRRRRILASCKALVFVVLILLLLWFLASWADTAGCNGMFDVTAPADWNIFQIFWRCV